MIPSLNRSALLLRPKQPFKDFCNYPPSNDWSSDCYVILVPDLQDDKDCIAYLLAHKRYARFFQDALEDAGSKNEYPDTTSLAVFLAWFSLEYHSVVFDGADDYLPVGPSRFDLYFREGTPNWYIGSNGKLTESEWAQLASLRSFSAFEPGYSNQAGDELRYRAARKSNQ